MEKCLPGVNAAAKPYFIGALNDRLALMLRLKSFIARVSEFAQRQKKAFRHGRNRKEEMEHFIDLTPYPFKIFHVFLSSSFGPFCKMIIPEES